MAKIAPRTRVSMWIEAPPSKIYDALVEPLWLTRFWLSSASAPLSVGKPVDWEFMVPGAKDAVTATHLHPHSLIGWTWSAGSVRVELEAFDGGTAVTVVNTGFAGTEDKQVEAALDTTEGFAIVLCDLKTLLETGTSAGLTKAKARLIVAQR